MCTTEGIIISFLFGAILTVAIFSIASADSLNIDTIGKYMCSQHNKTYLNGEIKKDAGGFFKSFSILCGDQKSLDDGYLVLIS